MTMRNDDATLKNNLPPNIITVIERGDDRIANGYFAKWSGRRPRFNVLKSFTLISSYVSLSLSLNEKKRYHFR